MIFHFYKKSYYQGQKKTRSFKLNISTKEPFPASRMRSICATMAFDEWGTINSQKTLISKPDFLMIDFDCSGHGGIVVFSSKEIESFKDFKKISSDDYRVNGKHFVVYMLEEDCNWVVYPLALEHPDLKIEDIQKAFKRDNETRSFEGRLFYWFTNCISYQKKGTYHKLKEVFRQVLPEETEMVLAMYAKDLHECEQRALAKQNLA